MYKSKFSISSVIEFSDDIVLDACSRNESNHISSLSLVVLSPVTSSVMILLLSSLKSFSVSGGKVCKVIGNMVFGAVITVNGDDVTDDPLLLPPILLPEGCITRILNVHHYLYLIVYLVLTCFVAHVDIPSLYLPRLSLLHFKLVVHDIRLSCCQ